MKLSGEVFFRASEERVEKLVTSQWDAIIETGKELARVIEEDGVIHIFGTGHSECFAMELVFRAGGLVPMHRMSIQDLALRGKLDPEKLKDPMIERTPEIAHQLWDLYRVEPKDAFILVSNSGINPTIMELATIIKAKGHRLIVVTSMEHSQAQESRHESGKKLYEMTPWVIDNCGPEGDALIEVGNGIKVCSISSITGAYIAQMLTAEIFKDLKQTGSTPPILISANVNGADVHNDQVCARYDGRWNA
ncbi:sugar isomerase domain-containing protein [Gottschalkiaceae bacterium SANA]|nr:sugar isomerase domain-containing protein [Gottschalkiaceae bacterium SANA]